jgi:hypothetical protein
MIVHCTSSPSGLCGRPAGCHVVCLDRVISPPPDFTGVIEPLATPSVLSMFGNGIGTLHQRALEDLDAAIVAALDKAKGSGVAQGLIVGLMHGHAARETSELL